MAIEIGGEIRENEESNEEKKIILEKLLDRDEEEPEVGERIFNISTSFVCSKQSFIYILHCFEVSYIFYGSILFFYT